MGNTASTPSNTSLPDRHPPATASASAALASPPPGCPMHQEDNSSSSPAATSTDTTSKEPSFLDRLNPLNNIPLLPQSPVSSSQQTSLSLERTVSSIPRAITKSSEDGQGACPVAHDSKGKQKAEDQDEESNWVYPSPQQFYNALMRKGKDTPEQSIDVMVHIHNFLNERAWDEVRRWEDMRNPGERIQLARFEGRPQDLSPKARFHLLLGSIFSNTYRWVAIYAALHIEKLQSTS